MPTTKIVKVSNQMEKMVSDLMKVHGEDVQVGHFIEQGSHSKAGISYVAMMKKHHTGYQWETQYGIKDVPPRPVIDILGFKLNKIMRSAKVRLMVKLWGRMNFSPAATKLMLNEVGRIIGKQEQKIFGDTSLLAHNHPITIAKKGFDAPLIHTEELKDKVAYKTSIDKVVREVK